MRGRKLKVPFAFPRSFFIRVQSPYSTEGNDEWTMTRAGGRQTVTREDKMEAPLHPLFLSQLVCVIVNFFCTLLCALFGGMWRTGGASTLMSIYPA